MDAFRFTARRLVAIALLSLVGCNGSKVNEPQGDPVALSIRIDSAGVLNGQSATVSIRFVSNESAADAIDSIASYNLLIWYDDSMLSFVGASPGVAVSSWDYFTFRVGSYGAQLPFVRVVGARSMRAGFPPPTPAMPFGEVASLQFFVTADRADTLCEPGVGFAWTDCADNTLADAADSQLLHFALAYRSNDSTQSSPDSLDCPRRYRVSADVEFVAGAIKILPPPDDTGAVIPNWP
jgi:hypothetical protein